MRLVYKLGLKNCPDDLTPALYLQCYEICRTKRMKMLDWFKVHLLVLNTFSTEN